jgi:hypothetical protein
MLLALKPPIQNGVTSSYDYSSLASTASRYSPPTSTGRLPSFSNGSEERMSNPHRGLPPPAGMTLPPPDRGLSAMAPLGQLPAPPSQWAGADESMRNWLQAKAEEDRRKQEEEKTKQEGLRLDQRRIEQTMLRESLSGGIPPVMVPLIFAGMGGAALSNQSLEWAQYHMAQMSIQSQQQQQQQQLQAQQQAAQQQQQQQQQQAAQQQQQQLQQAVQHSPDIRRDRSVPQNPYAGSQPILQPATQSSQQIQPQPAQTFGRPPVAAAPAPRPSGGLSRLNTVEMQLQTQPSSSTSQPGVQQLHPLSQSQSANEAQGSSSPSGPGLFFHHWTPPSTTNPNANSIMPPTPSGTSQKSSPAFQPNQSSHLRSEYQSSPKKRKATGGHQQAPPPTSQPTHTSPSFSARSSRERDASPNSQDRGRHSRQRSNGSSTRGHDAQNVVRPSSRQQRHEHSGGAGEMHLKRQATESSTSASGDERPTRYGPTNSETRHSPFTAGPEMRELPPKHEQET